jgi:[ribosomal protein S5]-alanine N-acetyltransferase
MPRLRPATGLLRNQAHGTEQHEDPQPFYRFTPSAWGRGLAGEAATAVTAWASRQIPDLPLIARVRPANVASQRVAIRAGLTRAEHLDTTGYDGLDWIFAANLPD